MLLIHLNSIQDLTQSFLNKRPQNNYERNSSVLHSQKKRKTLTKKIMKFCPQKEGTGIYILTHQVVFNQKEVRQKAAGPD